MTSHLPDPDQPPVVVKAQQWFQRRRAEQVRKHRVFYPTIGPRRVVVAVLLLTLTKRLKGRLLWLAGPMLARRGRSRAKESLPETNKRSIVMDKGRLARTGRVDLPAPFFLGWGESACAARRGFVCLPESRSFLPLCSACRAQRPPRRRPPSKRSTSPGLLAADHVDAPAVQSQHHEAAAIT